MIFAGSGLVRRRGKRVALFVGGKFETGDAGIIARLKSLGFREFVQPVDDTATIAAEAMRGTVLPDGSLPANCEEKPGVTFTAEQEAVIKKLSGKKSGGK